MTEVHDQSGPERSFPTVGRWRVTALPGGWMYVAGFGIKQMVLDQQTVAANVSLGEDTLGSPDGLQAYIGDQVRLIAHHLNMPKVAGPQPMPFPAAEESYLLFVRHAPPDACAMLHAQTYVRSGQWVGIVTLTTPESQLSVVRAPYDAFVKGLRVMPPSPPEPEPTAG